jgi:hypothetical protein
VKEKGPAGAGGRDGKNVETFSENVETFSKNFHEIVGENVLKNVESSIFCQQNVCATLSKKLFQL